MLGEEFVTAVICEVGHSTLKTGNCGHPPPLLIGPGGQVRALEASVPATPLGVGSNPAVDWCEVSESTRVLLYTDGLADALDGSRRAFDLGQAATDLAAGPLEAATGRLIDQLNAHAHGRLNDNGGSWSWSRFPRNRTWPNFPHVTVRTFGLRQQINDSRLFGTASSFIDGWAGAAGRLHWHAAGMRPFCITHNSELRGASNSSAGDVAA